MVYIKATIGIIFRPFRNLKENHTTIAKGMKILLLIDGL